MRARFFAFLTLFHLSLTLFRPEVPFNYSYGREHFVNFIVTNAVPKALSLNEIIAAVEDDAILTDVRQFITSGNRQKTELNKAYYSCREQFIYRGI